MIGGASHSNFGTPAVALLLAIWWLPKRQVHGLDTQIHDPKARDDTEDNFRKTVGQALGGAAVLMRHICNSRSSSKRPMICS